MAKTAYQYLPAILLLSLVGCTQFKADVVSETKVAQTPAQTSATEKAEVAVETLPASEQKTPAPVLQNEGAEIDLLKGQTQFQIQAVDGSKLQKALLVKKIGKNFILYYNEGIRQETSPAGNSFRLGCSLYTNSKLTAAEFSQAFRSNKGFNTVKALRNGVSVHFVLSAQNKKINLQCFKAISNGQAEAFTLKDLKVALGSDFKIQRSLALAGASKNER